MRRKSCGSVNGQPEQENPYYPHYTATIHYPHYTATILYPHYTATIHCPHYTATIHCPHYTTLLQYTAHTTLLQYTTYTTHCAPAEPTPPTPPNATDVMCDTHLRRCRPDSKSKGRPPLPRLSGRPNTRRPLPALHNNRGQGTAGQQQTHRHTDTQTDRGIH